MFALLVPAPTSGPASSSVTRRSNRRQLTRDRAADHARADDRDVRIERVPHAAQYRHIRRLSAGGTRRARRPRCRARARGPSSSGSPRPCRSCSGSMSSGPEKNAPPAASSAELAPAQPRTHDRVAVGERLAHLGVGDRPRVDVRSQRARVHHGGVRAARMRARRRPRAAPRSPAGAGEAGRGLAHHLRRHRGHARAGSPRRARPCSESPAMSCGVSGTSPALSTTSPVRRSMVRSTWSYATPYESASTISLSPAPPGSATRMSSREWLWPAITTSTSGLISRASSTISPTKSGALDSSCVGPPAWASTTIAWTPRACSTRTQRFTASEMSVKRNRRGVAVEQELRRGRRRDADEADPHARPPDHDEGREPKLALAVDRVRRDVRVARPGVVRRGRVHEPAVGVAPVGPRTGPLPALEHPDQLVAALVELVVAERPDVEPELVAGLHRGLVVEPAGEQRGGADHVAGVHADRAPGQRGTVEVRLQPRRAPDIRPRTLEVAVEVVHAEQPQLHGARTERPAGSPGAASPRWRRSRAAQRGARRRMPPRPEESESSGPGPPERPGHLVDRRPGPGSRRSFRTPAVTRSTSGCRTGRT